MNFHVQKQTHWNENLEEKDTEQANLESREIFERVDSDMEELSVLEAEQAIERLNKSPWPDDISA